MIVFPNFLHSLGCYFFYDQHFYPHLLEISKAENFPNSIIKCYTQLLMFWEGLHFI